MFGDHDPGGGADKRNGGGDIESVEPVAAGAADIEDWAGAGFGVEGRGDGFGAERAGEGGDFRRGLDFKGKLAEKIGFQPGWNRFIGELGNSVGHLFVGQMDGLCELLIKCIQHGGSVTVKGRRPKGKICCAHFLTQWQGEDKTMALTRMAKRFIPENVQARTKADARKKWKYANVRDWPVFADTNNPPGHSQIFECSSNVLIPRQIALVAPQELFLLSSRTSDIHSEYELNFVFPDLTSAPRVTSPHQSLLDKH